MCSVANGTSGNINNAKWTRLSVPWYKEVPTAQVPRPDMSFVLSPQQAVDLVFDAL